MTPWTEILTSSKSDLGEVGQLPLRRLDQASGVARRGRSKSSLSSEPALTPIRIGHRGPLASDATVLISAPAQVARVGAATPRTPASKPRPGPCGGGVDVSDDRQPGDRARSGPTPRRPASSLQVHRHESSPGCGQGVDRPACRRRQRSWWWSSTAPETPGVTAHGHVAHMDLAGLAAGVSRFPESSTLPNCARSRAGVRRGRVGTWAGSAEGLATGG